MANRVSASVDQSTQARTCAALAEAFHNADDSYLEAVAGGIMERQAEIDARADALVAFLTGPRPINGADAHAIIFAAMQAVVDGSEFDPAWRDNASAALVLLGARGVDHSEEVGKATFTDSDMVAMAAQSFEPVDADTLARMNGELAGKWNVNQQGMRLLMGLAFGLLAKTKAELMETAGTDTGIAAMEEAAEAFREKAQWLRSGASFLETAEARIMIAFAAVNEAEAGRVQS